MLMMKIEHMYSGNVGMYRDVYRQYITQYGVRE
jgi:hypothetical protein